MNPGVYIIKSLKNDRYYIGSTNDFPRRLEEHNLGKVFSTKYGRPWILMKFIPCVSITEAKQNEFRLKKYKRRDIVEKTIADSLFPWEYSKNNMRD
jgi:putative endonuclease